MYALGRTLEIVRTVLENNVNTIYICKTDLMKYYTCVCIKNRHVKQEVLFNFISLKGLKENNDYIGNFVQEEYLCLLFKYHEEQKLDTYIDLVASDFEARCKVCKNLIAAMQATCLEKEWLSLLILNKEAINITSEGIIYLNYYMDFSRLAQIKKEKKVSYSYLAEKLFDLLSKGYENLHELEKYPDFLRLYHKKMVREGFSGYVELYEYIEKMPKELVDQRSFKYKFKIFKQRVYVLSKKYGSKTVLMGILLFTLVFSIYQYHLRQEARPDEVNEYKGLYKIGTLEVYKEGGETFEEEN